MHFKGLFLISVQQPVFLNCVTITHLQEAEKNPINSYHSLNM